MSGGHEAIEGTVIRTTDKAVLVERQKGGKKTEVWIPRSVCFGGDTLEVGDTDIEVARWWLEREGIGD